MGNHEAKEFAYEVKLVQVERCEHLVPITILGNDEAPDPAA